MTDAYREFLGAKVRLSESRGFEIDPGEVNPLLKPHQRDLVCWGVRGGRRAFFARFGLGKSMIQLEAVRLTMKYSGEALALITLPLGVRQEFRIDAVDKLGWPEAPRFIRSDAEIDGPGVYMTNYESVREGKVTPSRFGVCTLDEASVLRSFGSKTYQQFMELFADVPYRYVATATPDPNRYKELIHYAGFLGIMDTGQALTRFFQRDSSKANNLTLYPHKEREFWLWVHSWAVFLQRPSDLGYSDDGYDLPPLRVHYHEIAADHSNAGAERDGQQRMFRSAAMGLQDAAREKRDSLPARIDKAVEIATAEDRHCILWHDLEDERRALKRALPEMAEVYGSLDIDTREQRVIDFSDGRLRYLGTKPELSGSGCNFQRHCSKAVFVGIGYQFNDFIQAIHRIHRFLQTEACDIHIVYSEAEREVLDDLKAKWARHDEQVEKMSAIIREYGLSTTGTGAAMQRSIGVERADATGSHWTAVNNDCVNECRRMDENSVGLIVTSIPFSNHYEYTPSYNDFGHTDSNAHFWSQMDYLTPELLRILQPGRVACIHVKDRILFGNVTGMGMPTVSPFHAEAIQHYIRHGFAYMGMITVVTDVVRENNQTYRLGWSEQCKDGTKMGVGSPEYVLLLRKLPTDRSKAYSDVRVAKDKAEYSRARWQVDAHAFWRSSGNRLLSPEELAALPVDVMSRTFTGQTLAGVYDFEDHVATGEILDAKGALPATFMSLAPGSHHPEVWHDVNRMLTLNGQQTQRGLQNHVCPLQFDIVDRLINRYSNAGDVVLDQFGGLMTVPLRAIKAGRLGYGIELNAGYWSDGVEYLRAAEREMAIPDLFATLDSDEAAA